MCWWNVTIDEWTRAHIRESVIEMHRIHISNCRSQTFALLQTIASRPSSSKLRSHAGSLGYNKMIPTQLQNTMFEFQIEIIVITNLLNLTRQLCGSTCRYIPTESGSTYSKALHRVLLSIHRPPRSCLILAGSSGTCRF